ARLTPLRCSHPNPAAGRATARNCFFCTWLFIGSVNMLQGRNAAKDLDFSKLSDEELVVLAQKERCAPAKSELLLRYHDHSKRLVGWLARQKGLGTADLEDVQQDAVFGIEKAIIRYDAAQVALPNGCHFQTFLHRVLSDRFKDFTKGLWRQERR